MAARWYVVNVYSGSEKKVAESIREQAVLKKMDDKILEVLVPTEQVVEIRKDKKVNAEHKFFPGYILIKMEMNDDTWHIVKDTPRVSGFLGSHNKPQAITEKEVMQAVDLAVSMQEDGENGLDVPNYVEDVSNKVVKLIQSYTTIVNKMVWRKY